MHVLRTIPIVARSGRREIAQR